MKKSIKSLKNISGKKVLLRLDLNVQYVKGEILDDHRLHLAIETIDYLLTKNAKLIIVSHLGRAKGKYDEDFSLKLVARKLNELMDGSLHFIKEHDPKKAAKEIEKLDEPKAVLLENLRFNPGELNNGKVFAKNLASLADIYVNDAFSVCHRAQASVSAVKDYLPSYAGIYLEKELEALDRVLLGKKPYVAIMGGAKLETKTPLIKKMLNKADKILVGGALANTIVKGLGYEVGQSLCDKEAKKIVDDIYSKKGADEKIILPIDFVVSNKKGDIRLVRPDEVEKDESILDIGPETITLFSEHIKTAATLIWNGPMGKFEEKPFRQGSLSVAKLVAARSKGLAFGVVGGGETVSVLKMTNMEEYVDFVSGAGGAMLSYLGGEKMPGLNKL